MEKLLLKLYDEVKAGNYVLVFWFTIVISLIALISQIKKYIDKRNDDENVEILNLKKNYSKVFSKYEKYKNNLMTQEEFYYELIEDILPICTWEIKEVFFNEEEYKDKINLIICLIKKEYDSIIYMRKNDINKRKSNNVFNFISYNFHTSGLATFSYSIIMAILFITAIIVYIAVVTKIESTKGIEKINILMSFVNIIFLIQTYLIIWNSIITGMFMKKVKNYVYSVLILVSCFICIFIDSFILQYISFVALIIYFIYFIKYINRRD